MPGQKNEMNMQKTKERVANLLRQDIGATQNVNLQNAQADREQLAFTSTKEEVQSSDCTSSFVEYLIIGWCVLQKSIERFGASSI